MPLMRILYLLLIAGSVFFYILYIGNSSFILMAFLILLPISTLVTLLITVKKIKIQLSFEQRAAVEEESIEFTLSLQNGSIFPVSNAVAVFEIKNMLNGKTVPLKISMPVCRKNAQNVSPKFSIDSCGIYRLTFSYIRFYDFLHLFTVKKKQDSFYDFYVLPTPIQINAKITLKSDSVDDSERYSLTHPGDDPSEIFNLREFVPGDKQNKIHWKLTAKTDKTFVKEYSLAVSSQLGILCEPVLLSNAPSFEKTFSAIMKTAASFYSLSMKNGGCSVVFPLSDNSEQIVFYSDESGYHECMLSLMRSTVCRRETLPYFMLNNHKRICSTLIYITADYDDAIAYELALSSIASKYIVVHITDTKKAGRYDDGNITYISASPKNLYSAFSDIEL